MRGGSFLIRSLIFPRIYSKVSQDTLSLFLKEASSQFWYLFVHQSLFLNSSGPRLFLLPFVIMIADIVGSEASVLKTISLMKRFLTTSLFILYQRLKNSSSALLLRENNFTSCNRAAILNFTTKNTLVPIPFYFTMRNSLYCSSVEIRRYLSRLSTRHVT